MHRIAPLLLLLFAMTACGKPPPAPPKPDPFKPARVAVADLFSDPNSAQFRREKVSGAGFICGEVNVKNGMGGYVGFVPYLYSSKSRKAAASGLPDPNLIQMGGYLNRASREQFDRYDDQCTFAKVYLAACAPPPDAGWSKAVQLCSVGDFHSLRLKMDALPMDR